MAGEAGGYPALEAGGDAPENGFSFGGLAETGKNAGAGAGHHGVRGVLFEPGETLGNRREAGAGHCFEVVMAVAVTPVGGRNDGAVALEFGRSKNGGIGAMYRLCSFEHFHLGYGYQQ